MPLGFSLPTSKSDLTKRSTVESIGKNRVLNWSVSRTPREPESKSLTVLS